MQDVVLQKRALSNCWLQQLDAQKACVLVVTQLFLRHSSLKLGFVVLAIVLVIAHAFVSGLTSAFAAPACR